MEEKFEAGKFDMEEAKKQIAQIKEAAAQAKKEASEKNESGETHKEPLGKKILGVLILIFVVVGIGFIIVSELDTLFLPKNSITLIVFDQNEEAIPGLKITMTGPKVYETEFDEISDITILDAIPGEYDLVFEKVPDGYTCNNTTGSFTLSEDGKVKLKYECTKEN